MKAPPGLALLTCGFAVGGRYACEALWGAGDAWQRGIEVAISRDPNMGAISCPTAVSLRTCLLRAMSALFVRGSKY